MIAGRGRFAAMPRIDYICHSCVLVTTSDTTILFDPWFHGPCYQGQWQLFPRPVGVEKILCAEHIVLTHGHEDHMHRPSLERIYKRATVWFPYQWRAGIEGYMKHIGFARVDEIAAGDQSATGNEQPHLIARQSADRDPADAGRLRQRWQPHLALPANRHATQGIRHTSAPPRRIRPPAMTGQPARGAAPSSAAAWTARKATNATDA